MTSVLIVEDHELLGQILARYLKQKGHIDVSAVLPSAEEALAQLDKMAVDAVLVDVSLPGMSGIELVAQLQRKEPDLPCLMLSAHADNQYVKRARKAGARGYVIKGDPRLILRGLEQVLNGGGFFEATG